MSRLHIPTGIVLNIKTQSLTYISQLLRYEFFFLIQNTVSEKDFHKNTVFVIVLRLGGHLHGFKVKIAEMI